jgi:hypothetical protein
MKGVFMMEVKAVHGYFKNGFFHQSGKRVNLPEQRMVIINVLNIPVPAEETFDAPNTDSSQEEKKTAFAALDGILAGHSIDLDKMREERILAK